MSEISGICLFLVTHLKHELTRAAYELRVWLTRARAQLKTLSSLLKNSFSFFQSNKQILSLDTVRVIILRQNLARVLNTHRRFLTLYFTPK